MANGSVQRMKVVGRIVSRVGTRASNSKVRLARVKKSGVAEIVDSAIGDRE